MRNSLILFCLALLFSCQLDNVTNRGDLLDGKRIASIEHEYNNRSWIETFTYDTNDRLVSVFNTDSFEGTAELKYENDLLVQIDEYSKDQNESGQKRTFIYDADDRVSEMIIWSKYPDINNFTKAYTHEYSYYSNGELKEVKIFFNRSDTYVLTSKYKWSKGNAVEIQNFTFDNGEEVSEYDEDLKFDNKPNFQSNYLLDYNSIARLSLNNATKVSYTDHSGRFDPRCNPCTTEIKYNSDNLPEEVIYDWDETLRIEYID